MSATETVSKATTSAVSIAGCSTAYNKGPYTGLSLPCISLMMGPGPWRGRCASDIGGQGIWIVSSMREDFVGGVYGDSVGCMNYYIPCIYMTIALT